MIDDRMGVALTGAFADKTRRVTCSASPGAIALSFSLYLTIFVVPESADTRSCQ